MPPLFLSAQSECAAIPCSFEILPGTACSQFCEIIQKSACGKFQHIGTRDSIFIMWVQFSPYGVPFSSHASTHTFYPSLAWPLRATACAAAGHAPVAGSAPHHQRTADIAGG